MRTIACLALPFLVSVASAQTIQAPFNQSYTYLDLGTPAGVPTAFGGCAFRVGEPDYLYLGGYANAFGGAIYRVPLTRDPAGHITGIAGPAVLHASAPFIDGGLQFGPGGVLFYTRFSNNELGMIRPGSSTTDKVVALTPLGIPSSVGALSFIPAGYPNVGKLKLASYSASRFATLTLIPDGNGTFDVINPVLGTTTGGGPEGILFVPPNSPHFVNFRSMLVSEYGTNRIAAYDIDANGDPIPATYRPFLIGLSGAEGSAIDPTSGDFIFSTFGTSSRLIAVRGLGASCGSVARYGQGLAGTGNTIPRLDVGGCFARRQLVTFDVSSGLPSTVGVYFAGIASASIPIFGGELLVTPLIIFSHTLDTNGEQSIPIPIPDDTNLLNTDFYSQVVYFDPSAPEQVSFSEGIQVRVL